jgi:hypothetical protein
MCHPLFLLVHHCSTLHLLLRLWHSKTTKGCRIHHLHPYYYHYWYPYWTPFPLCHSSSWTYPHLCSILAQHPLQHYHLVWFLFSSSWTQLLIVHSLLIIFHLSLLLFLLSQIFLHTCQIFFSSSLLSPFHTSPHLKKFLDPP